MPNFPRSLPEFQRLFPDEAACVAYLEETRWPEGFVCPRCGWAGDPFRFEHRPEVLRCRNCGRDISLTAGTIMERTHTPLCTWFWGAYLVTTHVPGMSAVQFQRQLGQTAFQMLHKLRAGMVRPERETSWRKNGIARAARLPRGLHSGACRTSSTGTGADGEMRG